MHHLIGQSVFDVDDDEAWGETFFVMHALVDDKVTTGYGRYIDYFRRIDGAWKLSYAAPRPRRPAIRPPDCTSPPISPGG